MLVSRVVRDLCAGKTFEFTSMGDATLKGFDEPVALYEVRADEGKGDAIRGAQSFQL